VFAVVDPVTVALGVSPVETFCVPLKIVNSTPVGLLFHPSVLAVILEPILIDPEVGN
jgi:hypothetical protein